MPNRRTASRSPRGAPGADRPCPRETWRQLLAAIDRTFHGCERYWHRGRYYVRHLRTFVALVRDPGRDAIEVRVAAPGAPGPGPADTYWRDPSGEDSVRPPLRVVRVRDRRDIRRALAAARRSHRDWGGRAPD